MVESRKYRGLGYGSRKSHPTALVVGFDAPELSNYRNRIKDSRRIYGQAIYENARRAARFAIDSGRSLRNGALLLCVLLVQAGSALGAPALTDISFGGSPGGKFEVRMSFDGTPPDPQGFTIEQPARIALDLPGVTSSLDKKKYSLSFDNAQSVRVLEAGGRTRVIIDLVDLAPYETTISGNELIVSVGSDVAADFVKQSKGLASRLASQSDASTASNSITDFNLSAE